MFLDLVDSWISSWSIGNWSILFFLIFLVIGVFFLVKCCDIFVDSAASIAKKAHVSPLVIGLTIVAMGTSCPELAVSASDSISALVDSISTGTTIQANIAMGNVVGSNICNILLVLGLSIIFTPIIVKKAVMKRLSIPNRRILTFCFIWHFLWYFICSRRLYNYAMGRYCLYCINGSLFNLFNLR